MGRESVFHIFGPSRIRLLSLVCRNGKRHLSSYLVSASTIQYSLSAKNMNIWLPGDAYYIYCQNSLEVGGAGAQFTTNHPSSDPPLGLPIRLGTVDRCPHVYQLAHLENKERRDEVIIYSSRIKHALTTLAIENHVKLPESRRYGVDSSGVMNLPLVSVDDAKPCRQEAWRGRIWVDWGRGIFAYTRSR